MNAFKQQCIELRKKDYTLNEIMRVTGKGKSTIYLHIKNIPLSERKKRAISKASKDRALQLSAARKGISARAFTEITEWNPKTVLLVAHLLFDGEINSHSCVYHNRSSSLVRRVEDLMGHIYKFAPRRHINSVTGVKRISYHNVALAKHIREKAKNLQKTITRLPLDSQREFLRAFFDDEGCMSVRRKNRRVRGYQKDVSILLLVQKLLKNFGIQSSIKKPNEVVIVGKENLQKFQKEINFSKGVRVNGNRTNSIWKKDLEKRILLDMAIKSFKH